jgi:two-component system chemotaxis response regulator CheY
VDKDKHILVVDDSPNIRRILVDGLQKLGFVRISTADDAVQGFAKLRSFFGTPTPVAFILSDLNMPGPSGLDFLKQIRTEPDFNKLPFVMVTTESEKAAIVEAAAAGVSGYVVKPFHFPTLMDRMTKAWLKHAG